MTRKRPGSALTAGLMDRPPLHLPVRSIAGHISRCARGTLVTLRCLRRRRGI